MTSAFKAYDIRGEIPGQVNVPFAYRLGQAVATELSPQSVVVGHDMRMDSPGLAQAIIQGLLDSGVDVLPLGRCGTEEVYFNTAFNGTDAGLMVTASHNPMNYNGIKMVLKGAQAATRDNALGPLEKLVYSDRKFTVVTEYARRGRLFAQMDKKAYVERLLSQVADIDLSPLKIVCHAGNGCAGPVIDLLEEFSALHLYQGRPRTGFEPSERNSQSAAARKTRTGEQGGHRARGGSRACLGR